MSYEIIAFSDDWHGLPVSCKHLLKHFLPQTRITWVETIGIRSPKLNLYDIKRSINKISGWLSKGSGPSQKSEKSLTLIDPPQIPYNSIPFVRWLNLKLMLMKLAPELAAIKRRGNKIVVITTMPFLGHLIGELGEVLSIYMRVDDFSEFPGVSKDVTIRLENELIKKVDMVVATAKELVEVNGLNNDVRYLPHGVDFEHFSVPATLRAASPVAKRKEPRIGFFGLLSDWIDLELLQELAKLRPDWSFSFIGPTQIQESRLPEEPNIYYEGPLPYDELPAHARHFDVGLIPFKVNKLTLAVNPLKFMEYLSMGFPVVSTPLPEITKYEGRVSIADSAEGFAAAIEKALSDDDADKKQARMDLASANDWKTRSTQLREWIEEALDLANALNAQANAMKGRGG